MKRGLLTKPWAIPGDAIGQKIPVFTVDMECEECHACGLVMLDEDDIRTALVCPCVEIIMQRVL
jgi:hypothetical protein